MIWTKEFWKGFGERAIKTAAQALVAAIGTAGGDALGLWDVSWNAVLSMAALTTLLSMLTSIVNADFTAGVPKPDPFLAGRRAEDGML